MRLAAVVAALTALQLATPAALDAQLSRPKIDTVGSHVVRVMNPGPTAWADTNGWKLVLERTIQPKDGEPGELQTPFTLLRTSTGQFVIGDVRAPDVSLFDASGHFVKKLGRSGEGPGEYLSPFIALFRDTVVIEDPRLNRVTLMTLDGKFVRSFPATSNSVGVPLQLDGAGRVRVPMYGRNVQSWNLFSITGESLGSIRLPVAAPPQEWRYSGKGGSGSYSIPFGANNSHRLLRDGSMLHGSSGKYELLLSRTGQDTARVFGRSGVSGGSIPESLRDSMFKRYTRYPEVRAIAKISDIPKTYPAWLSLHEDSSGNIWVLADGRYDGHHRFDVFTGDGRFLGSVALPGESGNVAVEGDRVAVIETDKDDLPIIRIYRIDRRGK